MSLGKSFHKKLPGKFYTNIVLSLFLIIASSNVTVEDFLSFLHFMLKRDLLEINYLKSRPKRCSKITTFSNVFFSFFFVTFANFVFLLHFSWWWRAKRRIFSLILLRNAWFVSNGTTRSFRDDRVSPFACPPPPPSSLHSLSDQSYYVSSIKFRVNGHSGDIFLLAFTNSMSSSRTQFYRLHGKLTKHVTSIQDCHIDLILRDWILMLHFGEQLSD